MKNTLKKTLLLTVLLSFTCTSHLFALDIDAQNTIVRLPGNTMSIGRVFEEIEKQTNYFVVFSNQEIDTNRKATIQTGSAKVAELLNQVFNGTDITYEFDRNYIVLKKSKAVKSEVTPPQNGKKITGIVTDSKGEPIIGGNVVEKGTTNGVITDVDGKFSLELKSGNATLVFSYIGYSTQEKQVDGQDVLNIKLSDNAQTLNEVVVTGFGLSQKKATLTGAVSSIGSKDLKRSNSSTTSGALVGKIAGVNTRQVNGEPGQATWVNIRNMNTPLYVIDGMQCDEGQFNNIDFNDIESISILKDASAAIYGMRAANGVIVVTTKRGKKGSRNTVSFNGYYGWQSLSRFAEPADARTYVTDLVQSETIQGGTRTISKDDYAKWMAGTEKGYRGFDWADYIWRTAPQYYANINVSGGTDKANYYLSIGRTQQEAMIKGFDGFNRNNVQMNMDIQVNDRIKVGASMNGRVEQRKNPASTGDNVYWIPRWSMFRNLPIKGPYANDNPQYPQQTSSYSTSNFAVYNYDQIGYSNDIWRVLQLNGNIEYKLQEGLTLKGLFGYYLSYNRNEKHEYSYDLYSYDPTSDIYSAIKARPIGNNWKNSSHTERLSSNLQLAYNKQFGQHKVDAVLGFEAIKSDNPGLSVNAVPTSNLIDLIDYNTANKISDYRQNNATRRMGWMTRINYDFANKYMLEFSARYDGSWKFPPHHRWGFFPSGSIGWRISEEKFWQDSKLAGIFSDFKIRGSYGVVGDDNVGGYGNFDYLSGYNYNQTNGVIDGQLVIGSQSKGLPVTTLSWIKAKFTDVGFDAGFLENRLTGQFDYFKRIRTGLPASRYDVAIPVETGFSLPKENLNSDLFKGFDAAVKWTDNVNDFTYSIGGNITYSRIYDWEQYKPRFGNSWEYYRSSSYHRVAFINWGYEAIGQFRNWEEIASYPVDIDGQGNKTLRPGDIIYKDVNKDGTINGMDERPIGYRESADPVLNWGLNFSFAWKGFDLAFDLTGGALASWSRDSENKKPFHDGGNNPQYYMEDTWHLADIWDADSEYLPGKHPVLISGNSSHSNYSRKSTFWTVNTKYMKLRNIEFGYTFPKVWLSKLLISDLRLYVSGSNLFTLTNTFDTDPETTNTAGLDYPASRVINIGLNVKF